MKKTLLFALLLITSGSLFAQNNKFGKIFISGDKNDIGKSYTIGTDKSLNLVLDGLKAYNALDLEKYLTYSSKEYNTDKSVAFQKKWFGSLKKVEEKPWFAFPLRVEGSNQDLVFVFAEENREFKNGSKEKLYVAEINTLNADGKVVGFNQFQFIPKTNEFGRTTGGKVYTAEGDTTTFTFTNRGEVELIEKFKAAYNKMDGKACTEFFTDSLSVSNEKGEVMRISKNGWLKYFDNIQSIDWKIGSILPTKISDTDPISGITVRSRTKVVLKDGTVKETNDMVYFSYSLEGKIAGISIWNKPVFKK